MPLALFRLAARFRPAETSENAGFVSRWCVGQLTRPGRQGAPVREDVRCQRAQRPPHRCRATLVTMSWLESLVDRRIREAQERGEFDDLPGAGKPLPGAGQAYDENWWIKNLIERENITGVLPSTLALRRQLQDLPETLAKLPSEQAVRDTVAAINEQVVRAYRGMLDGPAVPLRRVDTEEAVAAWRAARA
jgi:Domain of unknown function (DUF1992)